MPSLEYIVRPYQSPNAHAAIIIPATPALSRERATLIWGATAEMPVPETGNNVNVVCCTEALGEKARKSAPIRVYQDGDPNSATYVDIARPSEMQLLKKDTKQCFPDDWEQMSFAAASVSEVLSEWDDLLAPFDSTDEHCKVSWTFTYGQKA